MNPFYRLTEDQRRFAEKLGAARNNAKPLSIRDKHLFKYKSEHSHILGICAEIAYADITGLKLNEEIYSHGDDIDFDGIEIKTATWIGPDIELKIKFSEYLRKNPKIYTLARINRDYSVVEFIGSISRKRFDAEKYKKNHGYVDNWCVSGEQLSKCIAYYKENKLNILNFNETLFPAEGAPVPGIGVAAKIK